MLTEAERLHITELLLVGASSAVDPRSFLIAGLYDVLRFDFANGEPRVMVNRAIELCLQDGYQRTPSALGYLLTTLLGHYDGIAVIAERVSKPLSPLPTAPAATDDHFDVTVLDTSRPFMGRKDVRAFMRAWDRGGALRQVFVINGATKLGKTYTAEFVEQLSNRLKQVRHCVVSLEAQQGASTGALQLASDMAVQMGGNVKDAPPQYTNAERWTQDLVNWVMSLAASEDYRWCLVLDGFNNQELLPSTRDFINILSKLIGTGVHKGRHCLLLLDFDRTLLKLAPGRIDLENLRNVPAAEVQDYVATLKTGLQFDATVIGAKMIEGLGDPISDLPELGRRLEDLIAELST